MCPTSNTTKGQEPSHVGRKHLHRNTESMDQHATKGNDDHTTEITGHDNPAYDHSTEGADQVNGQDNPAFLCDPEDKPIQRSTTYISTEGALELKEVQWDKQKYKNQEGGTQTVNEVKPQIRHQVVGAVLTSLTHVVVGSIVGIPGVILPSLTDPNSSDIFLEPTQVALFGSAVHLGAIIGAVIAGVTNIYLGQRITLLVSMPSALVLWLAMSFTPSVWVLQLLRILIGVAVGLMGAASGNYVVEITHTTFRGRLTGMIDTGRQVGLLLVYIIGSLDLTWRQVMMVTGCITTIPPFIGFFFLPNSPRWLVTRGRHNEALKALEFFRGPDFNSESEFQTIVKQFQQTTKCKKRTCDDFRGLLEPSVLHRMLFLSFLMIVIQFTGNIPIATYIVPIFKASDSELNSYVSAMVIGATRVLGCCAFLLVVDRVGRRKLAIIPCIVCALSLIVLAVYFLLRAYGQDVTQIRWLPLAALIVFSPFVCACQSMVSLLRSELLPTHVRPQGTAILYILFFLGLYAATQTFPLMLPVVFEYGTFLIYSSCCILMALVIAAVLPETRGLSLEQIEDLFRYKNHASQEHTP
ncbi:hypothetical protein Pmani_009475 [Petrolisthes manimaculis]|uniref:Major facilitator superfamily (MFS) profile domain-containing protein n=1 Tax=Petrolisthes manimaculis TaxID=1843537 RepID=A0AAE1Q4U2_9EUCA|nr:hypothetical protein Pmani_009475 [Petrolisthes manimaculis]